MASKKADKKSPSSVQSEAQRAFFLIQNSPTEKIALKHKALGDTEFENYTPTNHSKLRQVWQEAGWINPGDVGRLLGLGISDLASITKGSKRFESDEEYERACKLIRDNAPKTEKTV